jgi:hypothetical protein
MTNSTITLTGIMATTDTHGRLRLCLVDFLPSQESLKNARPDRSWQRLREAIPYSERHSIPYNFPLKGAPDDDGVRGDCWITLPSRGQGAKRRRQMFLNLAKSLRGKEVEVRVTPKRYTFESQSTHNKGDTVSGTQLVLETLVELTK